MFYYYPAILERSKSGGFGVYFPDLPGCTSAGDSEQQAARNAEQALQGHIDLMLEDGDAVPEPSSLGAITVEDDVDEAARILVRVSTSKCKPVHVDLLVPEDVLTEVDTYAAQAGFTRAGLINQALRDLLREHRYGPVALDA